MRKVMMLVLVVVLVGVGLALQRYLSAETAAREVRAKVKNFPSALHGAEAEGSVGTEEVRQLVLDMVQSIDGVTLREDAVEVRAVPIEVGEGKLECSPPPFPAEMGKLSGMDQGNIQNLAIRCQRGMHLVGFHARGKGPSGKTFDVEGWSYVKAWSG